MSDDQLAAFKKKVEAQLEEEKKLRKPTEPEGTDEPPIEFVQECFRSNEVGDSRLYNFLHRDKFVANAVAKDEWLNYIGPHWEIDYHKQAKAAVEAVAVQYLRLLAPIEEELDKLGDGKDDAEDKKQLLAKRRLVLARLDRLRSDRGRNAVLNCASSNAEPLSIHPDRFDQEPWLFPCANGVINLRTGDFLEKGDPRLYLTMAAPTRWEGIDAPCPRWEKYLADVLDNNREVIDYLQMVLGYTITGLRTERIFVVLFGPHGQNGKGTLIYTLKHVLGPFSSMVATELLMSQKFAKSASSPSPELMDFKGKRLLYASETEQRHSFASGQIKKFSGGDVVKGRGLNDRYHVEFWPTHVLFLLCNDLPTAPAKDDAFWKRIKVFLFPFSFLPEQTEPHHRPVDPDMEESLKEESSGILAWLVRGCLKWQQAGHLIPPQKVAIDSAQYRYDQDYLQQFLEECCHVNKNDSSVDNRVAASTIYQRFREWWEDNNSSKPINQKEFSDQLQLKGFTKQKSGKIYYQYVTLKLTLED